MFIDATTGRFGQRGERIKEMQCSELQLWYTACFKNRQGSDEMGDRKEAWGNDV